MGRQTQYRELWLGFEIIQGRQLTADLPDTGSHGMPANSYRKRQLMADWSSREGAFPSEIRTEHAVNGRLVHTDSHVIALRFFGSTTLRFAPFHSPRTGPCLALEYLQRLHAPYLFLPKGIRTLVHGTGLGCIRALRPHLCDSPLV